jgi:hypothetical protein
MSTADDVVAFLQTAGATLETLPIPEATVIVDAVTAAAELWAAILDRKKLAFNAQAEIDAAELGVQAEIATGHKVGP